MNYYFQTIPHEKQQWTNGLMTFKRL